MNNIPEDFINKLKAQVKDQFDIITRYRDLKNNALDTTQKQKYQEEIDNRTQNIVEIQQDFLQDAKMLGSTVSEQILQQSIQQAVAQVEKEIKLKPVVFTAFANPNQDLQYLNEEQKEIQKLLMPLESQGQIAKHYNINNTSLSDYFDFIKAWEHRLSIFHFGGHAGSLEIRLQDGKVFFEHLAQELLNRNADSLQLVFLNGCATQAHVQNLFDLGANAVIATTNAVGDEQASLFAIAFYQNLVNGDTLAQAFVSAVNKTRASKEGNRFFTQGNRPIRWSIQAGDLKSEFAWGLYTNNDEIGEYRLVDAKT